MTCTAGLVGQRRDLLLPVALLPCRERLLQQDRHSASGPCPVQRLPLFLLMQQGQLPAKWGPQQLYLLQLLKPSRRLVLPSLQSKPRQLSQVLQSGLAACLLRWRAPSRAEWLKGRVGWAARIPLATQVPACRPPAPCSQQVTAAQLWPACQLRSRLMLGQEA